MIKLYSVKTIRDADLKTTETIPAIDLMYNAGNKIFNSSTFNGKTAIICGKGNNAGDGLVVALLLNENNKYVDVYLIEDKLSETSTYYLNKCKDKNINIIKFNEDVNFNQYDFIVDAIFGTGFKGKPEGLYDTAINKINNSNSYVISCDINSGLNGDTGLYENAVKSDLTVSVGYYKTGLFLNKAKDVIKELINVDINLLTPENPYYLLEEKDIIFKDRLNYSNKGDYGYIALVGGSNMYSGAIRLATMANCAMRSGAGVVSVFTPSSISNIIQANILESTIYPLKEKDGFIKFDEDEFKNLLKYKAITFGMGIGNNEETKKALEYLLLNYDKTLVIDADGLNALSQIKNYKTKAKLILTPHIKEFSRLTNLTIDEILNDEINIAKNYAKNNNVVLLLKGPTTIITDGSDIYLSPTGSAGMATAGSGDVLSGIIGALAGSYEPIKAAYMGAYINGYAGMLAEKDNSSITMVASDTVNNIKRAIELLHKASK